MPRNKSGDPTPKVYQTPVFREGNATFAAPHHRPACRWLDSLSGARGGS